MSRVERMCALSLFALACGGGPVGPGTTGLIGDVTRGPTAPVCVVDRPCDAPFSAQFTVWRGSVLVATFTSDTLGRFVVYLPPGPYLIQPAADAPIISPQQQSKAAVVGESGLTSVHLEFDTGIR